MSELLRATIALQEDSINMLESEVSRLTAERDGVVNLYNASVKDNERLTAECERLRGALKRLASCEAFEISRATNAEERARMRFAEKALGETNE